MSEYSNVKNTSKSDTLLLTFLLAAPLVVGSILSVTAVVVGAVVGSGIGQRMTDLVPFYYNYHIPSSIINFIKQWCSDLPGHCSVR